MPTKTRRAQSVFLTAIVVALCSVIAAESGYAESPRRGAPAWSVSLQAAPVEEKTGAWILQTSRDGVGRVEVTTPKEAPAGLTASLQTTVTKAGSVQGAVNVVRAIPEPLKAGQKLLLRFYARATTETPIKVVIMDQTEQPDRERDLNFTQALTPKWTAYTCPFVAKKDYAANEARILLRVGKGEGAYEFSQIELLNLADAANAAAPRLVRDFGGTAPFPRVSDAQISALTTEAGLPEAMVLKTRTPAPVPTPPRVAKATGPNIIFILCDDMGYGDIGPFGQKYFKTPNLDRMASEGQRWTQHYASSPVCVPTRASLMLGLHTGHSPIRDHQFDAPLPPLADSPTVASVLHQSGYATFSVGKWGLGGAMTSMPAHPQKRGFDKWFGLYRHVDGHVHYPDDDHPIYDGYTNVTSEHKDHYSTDLYTAKAKQYIVEQTRAHPNQPFFLYLAYIAPHQAYHVPDSPYPPNPGLQGGLQWPLKANVAQKDSWIYPDTDPSWTDWQKRYSTMVRRLDEGVGDLLQTLRDLGIDKNTLVVFTSDNGPARNPDVFSSWGNLDGFKRDLFEGGMREPTLAWWPGTIKPGQTVTLPSAHYDWLPTFAQLTGATAPAVWDGVSLAPTLTGRGTQTPHDYLYFEFHGPSQQPTDRAILARHGYPAPSGADPWGDQQAVRIGDFVGLRAQIQNHDSPLRLYNVVQDPHEDHDLAAEPQHAPLIARMKTLMRTAHSPQYGNPRPYDLVPLPATGATGGDSKVNVRAYAGNWAWTPDLRTLKATDERRADAPTLAGLKGKPGAVEVTGTLTVPQDGVYAVTVNAPGRTHLWVHDDHVVKGEESLQEARSGIVNLAKGAHPYRLIAVPSNQNEPVTLTVSPVTSSNSVSAVKAAPRKPNAKKKARQAAKKAQ